MVTVGEEEVLLDRHHMLLVHRQLGDPACQQRVDRHVNFVVLISCDLLV